MDIEKKVEKMKEVLEEEYEHVRVTKIDAEHPDFEKIKKILERSETEELTEKDMEELETMIKNKMN